MQIDASRYNEIRSNSHKISAGCVLQPLGDGTKEFMLQQGGDAETFILMLGAQKVHTPSGAVEILEGVFLSDDGPGFHPTWDHNQLMNEVERGSWTIVPTDVVLEEWVERVESRINKSR